MFYEYDGGLLNLNLVESISKSKYLTSNSIIFEINHRYYVTTFDNPEERDCEFDHLKEMLCK